MHASPRIILMYAALIAAFPAFAARELRTEKDKASYVIGLQVGSSLDPIKGEIDVDIVVEAMRAKLEGEAPALGQEEIVQVQKAFGERLQAQRMVETQAAAARNKTDGNAFLARNKSATGVTTTDSGLQYAVVKQGAGPKPKATDVVKVNYTGWLLDGTRFGGSQESGAPAQFAVTGVVPGWTEALQLMNVGSTYTLWLPSQLAYGDRGTPGPIGPNATLKFEIELLEIVAPE